MGHGDEWQMGIVHYANNFGGANGSVGNAGYQDRWLHGLGLVLLSYAKIQLRNESEREMGKEYCPLPIYAAPVGHLTRMQILKYRNNLYRNLHCFLRPAMPSVANTPFSQNLRNTLTINHLPFLQLVQPFCFHIPHCEKPRFEARNMANGTTRDGLSRLG